MEEGGFAGGDVSHDANEFSLFHLKVDVFEGDVVVLVGGVSYLGDGVLLLHDGGEGPSEVALDFQSWLIPLSLGFFNEAFLQLIYEQEVLHSLHLFLGIEPGRVKLRKELHGRCQLPNHLRRRYHRWQVY